MFKLVVIQRSRLVLIKDRSVRQYLVQWEHHLAAEALRVSAQDIHRDFPNFRL